MKTRILFIVILLSVCSLSVLAQAPQKLNYQAVVRGADSSPLVNTSVSFRFTIFVQVFPEKGDFYQETQVVQTNEYGLVNLTIGEEDPATFAAIDWDSEELSLQVECDPEGGSNYTVSEVKFLASVPYALHAESAASLSGALVWKNSGTDIYYNSGNVGIGTDNINSSLHIKAPAISGREVILRTEVADDPNSYLIIENSTISDGGTNAKSSFEYPDSPVS